MRVMRVDSGTRCALGCCAEVRNRTRARVSRFALFRCSTQLVRWPPRAMRAVLLLCLLAATSRAQQEEAPRKRGGRSPAGVSQGAYEMAAHVLAPDLFGHLPRTFLPGYKTPCWHANGTVLQCLPYFYLLGVFQCGTLDLYDRLAKHPHMARSHMMHFWDEKREFSWYQEALSGGIQQVAADPAHMVLNDPSFSTFTYTWSSSERVTREWATAFQKCRTDTCATQQDCVERQCYTDAAAVAHPLSGGGVNMTIPWLMRAAHGEHARFVVVLRDPVQRFHSAFWTYEHYQNFYGHFNRTFQPVAGLPPADESSFTAFALESVENLERCLSEGFSERECFEAYEALTPRNEKSFYHLDQLLKSLHSHWMAGWLEAFPRSSFLVLRLEDLHKPGGMEKALRTVFEHLDLPPASEQQMREMVALPPRRFRTQPQAKGRGEIEPATLARLRGFFKPYNMRLADMLGDEGFTWGY